MKYIFTIIFQQQKPGVITSILQADVCVTYAWVMKDNPQKENISLCETFHGNPSHFVSISALMELSKLFFECSIHYRRCVWEITHKWQWSKKIAWRLG